MVTKDQKAKAWENANKIIEKGTTSRSCRDGGGLFQVLSLGKITVISFPE